MITKYTLGKLPSLRFLIRLQPPASVLVKLYQRPQQPRAPGQHDKWEPWNSQTFVCPVTNRPLLPSSCYSSVSHLVKGINKWTKTTNKQCLQQSLKVLLKGGTRYASADRRMKETVENNRREGRQLNEDEVWEGMERQMAEERLI